MSKTSTPTPTQLELLRIAALLEDSLASGALGDSRQYLSQSRQYLLERHQALAPGQPVALPSGHSLLVRLAAVSLTDALMWERMGGLAAWASTEKHPFPLTEILSRLGGSTWGKNAFRWPSGSAAHHKAIQDFLINGLAMAMPIGIPDLPQTQPIGIKQRPPTLVRAFEAQCGLVNFCQSDDDLFTGRAKLRMFHQAQGVLAIASFRSSPDWPTWLDAGILLPTTPVLVSSPREPQVLPWTQVWSEQFPDAAEVFKRLSPELYDTNALRQSYLKKELPKTESWSEAKSLIEATPNGWNEISESGALLWQYRLLEKPNWLNEIVLEPKARLRQVSQNKQGIWADVFNGWSQALPDPSRSVFSTVLDPRPSQEAIECLATKVPLRLPDRGQLFLLRKNPHPCLAQAFDVTFEQHPESWVGCPDDRQATRAAQLLSWLLVGQSSANAEAREAAAEQTLLLHQAWRRAPESLTPGTVSVLWCAREYLAQAPLKLNTDVSVLVAETNLPPPADVASWSSSVLESARRAHPTVDLMKSLLDRANLVAMTDPGSASRTKPPGRHL